MSTTLGIINPATEQQVASVDMLDRRGDRPGDRARGAHAAPAWRAVTPADRARLLRRFADVVDAHNEELARLEVANSGHTISNARWEAGNVRDVLAYYAGARRAPLGQADPRRRRRRHHLLRAPRRRGHHRALELPHADRRLGLRPGARRGQHRGAQARQPDPPDRRSAWASWPSRPGSPRASSRCVPGRRLDDRPALRHPRGGAQGLLHRLERRRAQDHGGLRGPGQARHARAGRQERQHRLRRRRPGARRRRGALRGLRQRRPGLLRALAPARPGARPTTASWSSSRQR